MRKPFIIAMYTDRPLTDLQSRRRGRLIEKSKCYREYLKRLRRKADRRGDQWQKWPWHSPFFNFLYPAYHPRFDEANNEIASFEAGDGIPIEQWSLEFEAWKSQRRGRSRDSEKA
jgi:hypothetical protein